MTSKNGKKSEQISAKDVEDIYNKPIDHDEIELDIKIKQVNMTFINDKFVDSMRALDVAFNAITKEDISSYSGLFVLNENLTRVASEEDIYNNISFNPVFQKFFALFLVENSEDYDKILNNTSNDINQIKELRDDELDKMDYTQLKNYYSEQDLQKAKIFLLGIDKIMINDAVLGILKDSFYTMWKSCKTGNPNKKFSSFLDFEFIKYDKFKTTIKDICTYLNSIKLIIDINRKDMPATTLEESTNDDIDLFEYAIQKEYPLTIFPVIGYCKLKSNNRNDDSNYDINDAEFPSIFKSQIHSIKKHSRRDNFYLEDDEIEVIALRDFYRFISLVKYQPKGDNSNTANGESIDNRIFDINASLNMLIFNELTSLYDLYLMSKSSRKYFDNQNLFSMVVGRTKESKYLLDSFVLEINEKFNNCSLLSTVNGIGIKELYSFLPSNPAYTDKSIWDCLSKVTSHLKDYIELLIKTYPCNTNLENKNDFISYIYNNFRQFDPFIAQYNACFDEILIEYNPIKENYSVKELEDVQLDDLNEFYAYYFYAYKVLYKTKYEDKRTCNS